MRAGKSYVRDTGHFLDKLKELGELVPKNALLVTADVTSLYPSIPHEDGLRALSKTRKCNLRALSIWWNLSLKITILNLIQMFIVKFLVPLWALNLYRMHVSLWI